MHLFYFILFVSLSFTHSLSLQNSSKGKDRIVKYNTKKKITHPNEPLKPKSLILLLILSRLNGLEVVVNLWTIIICVRLD